MSTQDINKLSSVLRSITIIEEKANALQSQHEPTVDAAHNSHLPIIDDSNTDLQLFFDHFEQLLQTDLKIRKSFLNNNNTKRTYWEFFSTALKESRSLYDAVLYALNNQEVKTVTGRGRLFLRFCLQNHCLGDVVQQSFMMTKIVNQFYNDECFWTIPTYMNRIAQALYQLADLQYDLLSHSQYQLDVSWPTLRPIDNGPTILSDTTPYRLRDGSESSVLSMNSIDSQAVVSILPETSSIPTKLIQHRDSPIHDESSVPLLSLLNEDPVNTLNYWKEKCHMLEMKLQEVHSTKFVSSHDVEIQCCLNQNNSDRSIDNDIVNKLNKDNEQLQAELCLLKEENSNLTFEIDKMKTYENEIAVYKSVLENRHTLLKELQRRYDEQAIHLQRMNGQYCSVTNEQNQEVESLKVELEKLRKELEQERTFNESERVKESNAHAKLQAALDERTLDAEEMKRRLVKAVHEKAELFNSIHSYETKLAEELSRKWTSDDDVLNCTKCNILFGWTVRKHHCRHCERIFCYYCANNWIRGSKYGSSQYRICDFCNEKRIKESLTYNSITKDDGVTTTETTTDDINLQFEVRSERLPLAKTDHSTT